MMRSGLISVLCGLACVAACGDDGSGVDPGVDGGAHDGGPEPTINGKPASQFYAQFTHAVTHAEVGGAAAFPAQPNGTNAFLVQFFLMPGNQLVLFYAEGEGEVTTTGHSINLDPATKKRREGTWRIDGARLVLGSVMTCDGFSLNDKDALRCTLAAPVVTAAAQGRAGTFTNGFGASSPDDSEFADYTP